MTQHTRQRERGSALLVTLILTGALLAGSAVLVLLQMTSNRSTDMTKTGMSALYCAEAGLAAGRTTMLNNYPSWGSALASSAAVVGAGSNVFPEPGFFTGSAGINHDVDGDGTADFSLYIEDNDDELFPTANNLAVDIDLRVFLVSTCINPKLSANPKQVRELVQFTGGGQCYQSQLGGCGGNGNGN